MKWIISRYDIFAGLFAQDLWGFIHSSWPCLIHHCIKKLITYFHHSQNALDAYFDFAHTIFIYFAIIELLCSWIMILRSEGGWLIDIGRSTAIRQFLVRRVCSILIAPIYSFCLRASGRLKNGSFRTRSISLRPPIPTFDAGRYRLMSAFYLGSLSPRISCHYTECRFIIEYVSLGI